MKINKEGYHIIALSGVACALCWWLIHHLLVSDEEGTLLWISALLLLVFWLFIVAFFR